MLRKLGKSRRRLSSESRMEFKLLLAMTSVSREGNMVPNLRTSLQSCRLLSVMCSSRSEGHGAADIITVLYSLRHKNSSSNLDNTHRGGWGFFVFFLPLTKHDKRIENDFMFIAHDLQQQINHLCTDVAMLSTVIA